MKYLYDDVKTTYDAFQRGMKISGTSIYWTVYELCYPRPNDIL